jgi:uncharacterized protein (DUF2062 family)
MELTTWLKGFPVKKWLKKWMPTESSVQHSKKLKGLHAFFDHPELWKYNCQSVARGVAAGLASSVIPGVQVFYAAGLVILFRGNLPVAMVCTLVSNPLTVIPITYFIYQVGISIIGNGNSQLVIHEMNWDFSSLSAFWDSMMMWLVQFGKAFLIGAPIVSFALGVIGYFGTILIWKVGVFLFGKRKRKTH